MLGYPVDILILVLAASLVRVISHKDKTFFAAIVSIIVAVSAGILLFGPVVALLSLSAAWNIPIAILIALSAENIMRSIVAITGDAAFLKDIIRKIVLGLLDK
ncbi:hypothetical protein EOK75_17175 (plasmid) [Pseudorhodobacter turbinis]|uniref:Uncharacterized protein n=1 Tax=Pseudorhodobacter turbinis TaxID=2500533 RepID=A0A4P8EK61_9RHOB|nr:hypothetical protein [Pseudorhodobacter turbinis]QCO57446.1 hypothetical protein EOK75_17175 [Pseudorhodobacter turbinis]